MDLARLRFGDWVMGLGGVAVLVVMFVDWYELVAPGGGKFIKGLGDFWFNAWESFAVNDVVLALAAILAIAAFIAVATQPTAAVPLALASFAAIFSITALVLVTLRIIWPPDLGGGDALDTGRLTGAWLGLVATAILTAGCLASMRDERSPRPEHPVEPRLVRP